jgi:hypothetical protein
MFDEEIFFMAFFLNKCFRKWLFDEGKISYKFESA